MAIPPLVLRIYADSSGVKKGVAQAQTQVGGLRASIARNASLIKTGLIAGAVVGFVKATQAAADLGEAQNKVNVVFGKSVGIVNRFVKSSNQIGLAKAEALGAAGAFGSMFDSAGLAEQASATMSTTMVQLAADMASFNNEDPSEMLDRLRSGLAGEAEPLRRFGVFISEARVQTEAYESGIAKVGEELTDAQKVQARYNIVLQDTNKQQGDFARTAGESMPNQLRILRAQFIDLAAKIGQVVIPIVTAFLKGLNAVISFISTTLWPGMKSFAKWLANTFGPAWEALRAIIKPIVGILAGIFDGIMDLVNRAMPAFEGIWKRVKPLWESFEGVLNDVWNEIQNVIGALDDLLDKINAISTTPGEWFGNITGGGGPHVNPETGLIDTGQHGLSVRAGVPFIANEETKPELFVSRVSGEVIPMGQWSMPPPNVQVFLGDEEIQPSLVRVLNRAVARA